MIEKKFIKDNIKKVKAKEYVRGELERAGVVDVSIQRTTLATRIAVKAEKPGLIIGKKGKTVKDLSEAIAKSLGVENPQIEVVDVQEPDMEPRVVARWIVHQLEKGTKPKKVIQIAVDRVMNAGALGVEIIIKGKLQGKGAQARRESILKGYLKKAGDMKKLVREAKESAVLKQGIIGIVVRIVPRDVIFSDKMDLEKMGIISAEGKKTPKAAEGEEKEEAKEEEKTEEKKEKKKEENENVGEEKK